MKLIFSSFSVGFITSMTVSYDIGEKLLERRFASKQIYLTNEEELDARRYQRVSSFLPSHYSILN